ncbi:hypothetical protein [Nonomuraea insulae]|uniref:Uncharacterized protein n=1 Tax=Nonomuraea insulae TaxID=1616787 RepID=A0ABW1CWV9_9ACTN
MTWVLPQGYGGVHPVFKGHFRLEDVTFIHAEPVNARLDPSLSHFVSSTKSRWRP